MRNSSKNLVEDSLSEHRGEFHADFGARLSGLIAEFGTKTAAGEIAGVTPDMLPRYARGVVKPPLEVIARLAEAKNVSIDWLWSGKGARKIGDEPPADESSLVRVPIYDVRAGAGFAQVAEAENIIGALSFDPLWLVRRGIKPKGAFICFGTGDSMAPTILDGDPIIADSTDKELRDKVFVCRRSGGLIIKRLQRRSDGTLLLISDNPAYKPEELPRDEADSLEILGRVGMVLRAI